MRKVAIVMLAGSHRAAPWADAGWEVWGAPWISYPRVDRFYEIHEEGFYTGPDEKRDRILAENIDRHPLVPVFCTESRKHLFKNPQPYPFRGVIERLPVPFLEDTVCYMLAHAIYERVDEIGLWGVHMVGRNDYIAHRPSVTYLIGLAQGRGVPVTVCPGSPLFMSRYTEGRYGITIETRY